MARLWLRSRVTWMLAIFVGQRFTHVYSSISRAPGQYDVELAAKLSVDWSHPGDCLPIEDMPIAGKNLTDKELALLPYICWRADQPHSGPFLQANRGIPAGVKCNITQWCDEADNCSEVCERGTVEVDPWLQNALKTQWALSRKLPLCMATLPGTHNSAITLADGYGNLDPQFQEYFKWIRWVSNDARLRTNDHIFSLTDQMNLGVRSVELDTHWVEGALRIAHCGGLHSAVNVLIDAVNLVAKLLGHPIHWDSETVGCNPSLSSIPVLEQRTFLSALQEIALWLQQPQNENEFLVLYLDDQPDLAYWGVLPELFSEISTVFSLDTIFTPLELMTDYNGSWPSINTLSASGKQVLFVTGYDFGELIDPIMFSKDGRHTVCGWTEPMFSEWEGQPECLATGNPYTGRTLNGTLFRILTCDLFYGPMNCDFVWSSSNEPLLDELSLPDVYRCGVNMPSPDLLTPARAASTIWSWASGEPYQPSAGGLSPQALLTSLLRFVRSLIASELEGQRCAALSAEDGRWRTWDCGTALPSACRSPDGRWLIQEGPRGQCPDGHTFDLPHHAKENTALQAALHKSKLSVDSVWLALQGPDWDVAAGYGRDEVV